MKIELDVHTHTIASGHAFSSLQEMVRAAADKGLKLLGITEHTPGIPGSCHLIYFRNRGRCTASSSCLGRKSISLTRKAHSTWMNST